jgi:hypothetical protein
MPWYTQNPILWPGKSRINIDKLFDFEIPPEYHLDKIGPRHCWLVVWDPHPSYGKLESASQSGSASMQMHFCKISVW